MTKIIETQVLSPLQKEMIQEAHSRSPKGIFPTGTKSTFLSCFYKYGNQYTFSFNDFEDSTQMITRTLSRCPRCNSSFIRDLNPEEDMKGILAQCDECAWIDDWSEFSTSERMPAYA